MSTTLSGKATSTPGSSTCSRVSPCATIISAMSPTTLDDGVTLTMSPNIRFTSAYIVRDLVPALLEPHRPRLRLEVGELPARHLVQVDLRGRRLQPGLEGGVLVAHRLPVVRDRPDRLDVEPGVALGPRAAPRRSSRGRAARCCPRSCPSPRRPRRPRRARRRGCCRPRRRWCRGCGSGSAGRPPPSAS